MQAGLAAVLSQFEIQPDCRHLSQSAVAYHILN
jgi:hypothetical protein